MTLIGLVSIHIIIIVTFPLFFGLLSLLMLWCDVVLWDGSMASGGDVREREMN